jgi:hypothetical protein
MRPGNKSAGGCNLHFSLYSDIGRWHHQQQLFNYCALTHNMTEAFVGKINFTTGILLHQPVSLGAANLRQHRIYCV